MGNHYYTENPETAHDFEQWSFELKGKKFQFVTDSGVFSGRPSIMALAY